MNGEDTGRRSIWSLYPALLFALLAIVLLAVFLLAPVSVTLDGYSHLYGANVLNEMLGGHPEVQRYFSFNSALLPNWLCPLLLAALSHIVPAEFALKLLIVLTSSALLFSFYFCIDVTGCLPRQRAQVLILLLPFALNGFLTLGFYGFLLSASMCILVLGLILRQGLKMPLRFQIAAALLLLTAYFSNPLPVLMSCLFPLAHFVAEAIDQREHGWRRVVSTLLQSVLHSWPWAPPICLILWFYSRLVHATKPHAFSVTSTVAHHAIALVKDALLSISPTPLVGTLYIALVGILCAGVFLRRERLSGRDSLRFTVLAMLTVSTVLLYLAVPDSVGEGSWIPARFLWYSAFLLVMLALTGRVSDGKFLSLSSLVASVVVVGFAGEYLLVSRTLASPVAELRLATEKIPEHSRVLILAYRLTPSCQGMPLLERALPEYHLALAGALKNQLIVLNDYEATSSVFPLRYRGAQSYAALENDAWATFDDKRAAWSQVLERDAGIDFVVSWGTPSGPTYCTKPVNPPFEDMLRIRHDLVFSGDGASRVQLWRKRG